jgi:hypothetical protein
MIAWDGLHVLLAVAVTLLVLTVEQVVRGSHIWKRARPRDLHGVGPIVAWICRLVWFYGLAPAIFVTGIYVVLAFLLSEVIGSASGLQIALVSTFATTSGMIINVTKDLLLVHREHRETKTWVAREGLEHVLREGRKSQGWRETFTERLRNWKDLDLLVVTGMSTIGASNALLSEYLQRPNPGRLRVLLLSPESDEFAKRASRVGCSRETYRKAAVATIAQLEKLRRRKGNVDYRFYDGNPIWRIFMGSGEALVQHVAFSEQEANQPIYRIASGDTGSSFYPAFQLYFETLWENSKAPDGEMAVTVDEIRRQSSGDEGSGLLDILRRDAEQGFQKAIADEVDAAMAEKTPFDSFQSEPDTDAELQLKRPRRSKRMIDN